MEGHSHDRSRRVLGTALASSVLLALLPGASLVLATEPASLPPCPDAPSDAEAGGEVATPWRAVLDDDGALVEHRMTLRRGGIDTTQRTGPRGFVVSVRPKRVLIGERSAAGTALTMVDTTRGCLVWRRDLERHAYPVDVPAESAVLRMEAHEPSTRRYAGTLLIDADSGATEAMIDGECSTTCNPNDGDVFPAAFGPIVAPQPVPAFAAGGWPRDKTLRFSWRPGAIPPAWAKEPLLSAAEDVQRTARARSPRFVHRSGAANSVRYTAAFPTFCRYGIACASRNLPTAWAVWLRPHRADFSWGTLRWCQRRSASGCFDMRRVMLHELGHVTGLQHPSSVGFRLAAGETVMHAITPAKPSAGSTRHAFGRCDVATLQELYDVPTRRTLISACNSLNTALTLTASRPRVPRGETVLIGAQLRIAGHGSYGLLAGNALDGRAVKLKYRRARSKDAWTSLPMEPVAGRGRYAVSLAPTQTWDLKATFRAPSSEGLRFSRSEVLRVRVTEAPDSDQPPT